MGEFCTDLDKAMRQCRSQEINIVMGDLNAKVRKGQYQDTVQPYGLGTRNDKGDILLEWCNGGLLVKE